MAFGVVVKLLHDIHANNITVLDLNLLFFCFHSNFSLV